MEVNGLVEFDLAAQFGIDGVAVTSAVFEVYENKPRGAGNEFAIYRNDLAWDEHTVSTETWGQYADRYDRDTTYGTITTSGNPAWWSFEVTDLVQSWLDGDAPNYGFVIASPTGDCDYPTLFSSDTDDDSLDPKLTITYTLTSVEEATWGQIKASF